MATILDSFLVTLGLDNHKFKEGAQEVTAGIQKMAVKAGELFAIFAGGMELKEFIHSTIEVEISTLRLSDKIGMNIEELQKWQGAATLAGGSAEGFSQAINSMGGMLVDIEKKLPRAKRALTVLQAAGVTGLAMGKKTDVLDVLDQLSEKMKGMGGMEASRLGSRMGLDDGTIRLLRKGKEGIAELRKEAESLGLYTREDAQASLELEEAQKRLELSGKTVGRQIMTLLMPALKWMADKFLEISKWAAAHGDVVRAAFIGIAVAATAAAIAVAAASWEFVLLAAAITAVVVGVAWLVMAYKKWDAAGGETTSRLGKFFKFIQDGWLAVKDVFTTYVEQWWEIVKDYVALIEDEFELLFALLSGDPDKVTKAFETFKDDGIKLFKELSWMAQYEMTGLFATLEDLVDNFGSYVERKLPASFKAISGAIGFLSNNGMLGQVNSYNKGVFNLASGNSWGGQAWGSGDAGGQSLGAKNLARHAMLGNNDAGVSGTTTTTQIHIENMPIYTQATDGAGIAKDVYPHMVSQAEMGLH